MAADLSTLIANLNAAFGDKLAGTEEVLGEVTAVVKADALVEVMTSLRDSAEFSFEQMTDLCGMDYSAYGDGVWQGKRFAVVYHLLSVKHNMRLRVRAFAEDDDFPLLDSVADIWPFANWCEREAFDLFGIVFAGHPDLRRILTDYGFVGNPFRKDFPLSGQVEMRYDPEQRRVVYQPVSIDAREITPRIVREQNYGCN